MGEGEIQRGIAMHDDELRRELRAVQERLTRAEARLAAMRPTPRRVVRRARLRAGLALALLLALVPLGIRAASPFNDLTGGVHDGNIDLIYDAGITKGCVPNVSYCPTANVTREEMASFLARTAGLGSNPPVMNAKTAQTATLATNATNAVNATNATSAGHATSADTAANATNAANAANATNATQLGGQPASAYVRTNAAFVHTAAAATIGFNTTTIDNPLANGQPNRILLVTPNFQPNSVYNAHPIGVYYASGVNKWVIFNEDLNAMPTNSSYNVLVIQP